MSSRRYLLCLPVVVVVLTTGALFMTSK